MDTDGPEPTSTDYRHAAAQLSQSRHGHLQRTQYVRFQKTAIVDGEEPPAMGGRP